MSYVQRLFFLHYIVVSLNPEFSAILASPENPVAVTRQRKQKDESEVSEVPQKSCKRKNTSNRQNLRVTHTLKLLHCI